jgi:hypothetical protein
VAVADHIRVAKPRTTLYPLFITVDEDLWMLEGIVRGPADALGALVTLEVRPPESRWLGIILEELLGTWMEEGRVVDLDLGEVRRPRPTIGLSCEDTSFWLELIAAEGFTGDGWTAQAA